jgi:hypothetical protein
MAIARTQRTAGRKNFNRPEDKDRAVKIHALNPKNNFSYPDLNQADFSGFQRSDAFAKGIFGQFGHAVEVEFFHDLPSVGFHGLAADAEF